MARFLHEVDPRSELPFEERQRRAEAAKRAYFIRLALKSSTAGHDGQGASSHLNRRSVVEMASGRWRHDSCLDLAGPGHDAAGRERAAGSRHREMHRLVSQMKVVTYGDERGQYLLLSDVDRIAAELGVDPALDWPGDAWALRAQRYIQVMPEGHRFLAEDVAAQLAREGFVATSPRTLDHRAAACKHAVSSSGPPSFGRPVRVTRQPQAGLGEGRDLGDLGRAGNVPLSDHRQLHRTNAVENRQNVEAPAAETAGASDRTNQL